MVEGRGRRLAGVVDSISTVGLWVSGVFLAFTVVSITLDVFMRYYLNMPQVWLTEIIEIMMLFITFLGGAWVVKENGHVTVDIMVTRWNRANQRRSAILSNLICCFVCLVLIVFGFRVVFDFFVRDVHTVTVLELPMYPLILVIPVGALMMLCQLVVQLLTVWKAPVADQA